MVSGRRRLLSACECVALASRDDAKFVWSHPDAARALTTFSVFANVDYEFAAGAAVSEKRNEVRGAFGARYLVVGDFARPTAALSDGGPISVGSGSALGGYGAATGPTVNNSTIRRRRRHAVAIDSPTGTFTIIGNLLNRGVIQLA